jgi:hypothetical protein
LETCRTTHASFQRLRGLSPNAINHKNTGFSNTRHWKSAALTYASFQRLRAFRLVNTPAPVGFTNKDAEQPLTFNLTFVGKEGNISNPWIEMDGYLKLELPAEYEAGNSVVCDGVTIKLYNKKGGYVKDIVLKQSIPTLKTGKHNIKFDCRFPEEKEITTRFIVKTKSSAEIILN